MTRKRIGILTGGGDSPGLNAAIRGAALTAMRTYDMECVGFIDGFNGLFEEDGHVILDEDKVQGILALGGTMLGTANRGNPFKMVVRDSDGRPVRGADGEILLRDRSEEAVERIKELNIAGLLCIGGDGTLRMAQEFYQKHGVPVVGVPKTIDFDLAATEATFGFKTAVQVATEALDRLRTTADSHDRVLILELMGRYAGWISLYAGIAGGAHAILLPEIPYELDSVVERISGRFDKERRFSLVVVSEGALPKGGARAYAEEREHPEGLPVLGGAGDRLRHELETRWKAEADAERAAGQEPREHPEVRVVVLGHIQRGGTPLAEDRIVATACGAHAAHMAANGEFGKMAAWRNDGPISVELNDALQEHFIEPDTDRLLKVARSIGVCVGD